MFSIRNIYTPESLAEPIAAFLPPGLQKKWRSVQALQQQWATARDTVPLLEAAANDAPAVDAAAAREAAAAGKPIPDATSDAARTAVEKCRREVHARAELANTAEINFMNDVRAEQETLVTRALDAVDAQTPIVLDALAQATTELDRLGAALGLYWWAVGDLNNTTVQTVITWRGYNGYDEALTSLLEAAADTVRAKHPREVLARQAEQEAANEALRQGRQHHVTADGLVIDAAAYRAYSE